MSAVALSSPGPVLIDELSELGLVMGGHPIAKPSGPYADTMVSPSAWPDFDEAEFNVRQGILSALKSAATAARRIEMRCVPAFSNGPSYGLVAALWPRRAGRRAPS